MVTRYCNSWRLNPEKYHQQSLHCSQSQKYTSLFGLAVFVYLCFSSHSALCTGDVVGCNELWRILPQPITSPTSTTYLLMVRTLWRSGNYQGCCFQWRGCSDNFHFLKKWCEPNEKQADVGKMCGAEVKLQNAASKQEGRWRGRTEGGGGQNWMATVRARLGETKPT